MSYNKSAMLTVCATALLAMLPYSANAQEAARAMEESMRAGSSSDLAIPTGTPEQGGVASSLTEAPATTPLAELPSPPPILDATSPEVMAASAPAVGTQQARSHQRITTVRDAVAVGVLTNPETEAVQNNRRATDEELKQAKALYRPSIDFRADTGFQSINSDPDNSNEGHSDLWRSQATLTLTQMLFDGFATKYENDRQYHRVRSASHRVRETAEFIGLDIIEAYLDVLRQRELLQIAAENRNQHNYIMQQIEDSVNAGRSTRADLEQTKARLNAAEAQEAIVRQSLNDAESKYRRRVGDVPQPDLQVPVAPRQILESNVDNEVKQVLTHSPTLDTREADVNVAAAEREAAKSTLYPKVDFQAGATIGHDLDGVEGRTQEASALVIANWNLYRGGGDEARTREFVYRHAQVKNERNATARAVEQDVRQTWSSMVSAGERALAFRKQAEANAMVVEAYKDQFNLDRRTLLDVLDAQNEWFVSRSNAINNGYLEMFAVYRLIALRGDLLPTLQVSYPTEVNPANKS